MITGIFWERHNDAVVVKFWGLLKNLVWSYYLKRYVTDISTLGWMISVNLNQFGFCSILTYKEKMKFV